MSTLGSWKKSENCLIIITFISFNTQIALRLHTHHLSGVTETRITTLNHQLDDGISNMNCSSFFWLTIIYLELGTHKDTICKSTCRLRIACARAKLHCNVVFCSELRNCRSVTAEYGSCAISHDLRFLRFFFQSRFLSNSLCTWLNFKTRSSV